MKIMKNIKLQYNKKRGFTLIETMIAVFILAAAMNGLLGLISNSLYTARYTQNTIVANYLIQEAVDYIRNDRDTTAFQRISDPSYGWTNFLNKYGYTATNSCFSTNGCEIELTASSPVSACNGTIGGGWGTIGCRIFNYDENATNKVFYTYQTPLSGVAVASNFKRKVSVSINTTSSIPSPDELDIIVTVEWKNGNLVRSKTLRTSLLNWQKP